MGKRIEPKSPPSPGLGQRLHDAIAYAGRSLQWLESPPASWPRGYPSMVRRGERKSINVGYLRKAAEALGVRFEWLATGVGPMLGDTALAGKNVELAKAVDFLRGMLPDAFLDGWIGAQSDVDWTGVDREGFRKMIEADFLSLGRTGAASRLEVAREKKIVGKRSKLP